MAKPSLFSNILRAVRATVFSETGIIGIDIGTTSIKAVELAQSDVTVQLKNYGILENYGHLERENAAIQTSSLKIIDEMTAQMLKELLKQMGTNQRNAIFSLPAFSSFVTAMDLPNLNEKEMASAIPYEARQYVPIPLSEVVLDWQILNPLPGVDTNRIQVLLIAVPQEVVNKYYRIAQLAGLNLKSLELESVSLARAFAANDPTPSIVIDMGSRATSITVIDEKNVRMAHEIDTAGNDLTLAISRGLNIGAATAEQMKKDRGLAVTADAPYVPSLLTPLLDVVVSEVNKVRQRYLDKTRREIKRVILTGAAVLPPGIRDYFAQELQLETLLGNAFNRVSYNLELKPLERELCGYLSIAVGAGLKHF